MTRLRSFSLAAIIVVASVARAQAALPDEHDHALPCRPTIACTADIVTPGSFEVEAGALHRRNNQGGRAWTSPFLLKLTVADWLQWQVGSNGYGVFDGDASTRYLDDAVIGAKIHARDQSTRAPSLSLSASLSVPTFHSEGYLRTTDALFTLYATKDVGPLHIDVNVGLNLWRIEDHPLPQEFAALALSTNIAGGFGVMGESYVFSNAAPAASRDGGLLAAVSFSPRPWLVLDTGFDVGFFPATRAVSLFAGATVIPLVVR